MNSAKFGKFRMHSESSKVIFLVSETLNLSVKVMEKCGPDFYELQVYKAISDNLKNHIVLSIILKYLFCIIKLWMDGV